MAVSRTPQSRQALEAEGDRLYEEYGKPLEADHWGEFIAISPDGRVLLGTALHDVVHEASEAFGTGSFFFQIGPRAVGSWR